MITRRILAAMAAAFVLASPAYAQKSKSTLSAEISANFPDNSAGFISPALARSTFVDFLASWQQWAGVNAQTGTTYTVLASDYGQVVTFDNAGAKAVTVPQATGSFSPFNVTIANTSGGSLTITPTTSTINGGASYVLAAGQSVWVVSDGTNYRAIGGMQVPTITCATHQWVNQVSGTSIASCTQPGFSDLSGNIATSQMNSGTGASSSTYWRGDGTWATPASGGIGVYNIVADGGAKCDRKVVSDAAIGIGSSTLTSATAGFSAGDVGKYIAVQGAGAAGVNLFTTVAGFTNSTTITLTSGNASGSALTGKIIEWGTDDTTAINNSITAAVAASKNVYIPPSALGCFASRINLTGRGNLQVFGNGMGQSAIYPLNDASYGTATGHLFDLTGSSYIQIHDLQIGAFYELAHPTTAFFLAQVGTGAANVVTLGPNLYVSGTFTATVYNYGVPSSNVMFSQFYNYSTTSPYVLILSGTNVSSFSSSFATVTTGTKSTSDITFIKDEMHSFSGQNATGSVVLIDNASVLQWLGGNITGGAQYYVSLNTVSHVKFPGVTFETESQPTPAYVFAVGSGAGTITDVSYDPPTATNMIYGTGVWSSAVSATNLTTNGN